MLTVVSVNHKEISEALENKDFKDFEDRLQDECAKRAGADYIITRNMQDFQYSKVRAVLPDEFIEIMTKNKQAHIYKQASRGFEPTFFLNPLSYWFEPTFEPTLDTN